MKLVKRRVRWVVVAVCTLVVVVCAFSAVKGYHRRHPEPAARTPSYQTRHLATAATVAVVTTAESAVEGSISEEPQSCNVELVKSWQLGVVSKVLPAVPRDCQRLSRNDPGEVLRVRQALKSWRNQEDPLQFKAKTLDCEYIREEFRNNFYVSQEEREFPLAFILVVYTNPQQIFRLLKVIYRPHNVYCLHPDIKQGREFTDLFISLSKCLDNVFVASRRVAVYWGHHSIMDAQMSCMWDLVKRPAPLRGSVPQWKYVVNLCGRELPLVTNREMVRGLKKMNGVCAIDTIPLSEAERRDRFTYKAVVENGRVVKTDERLEPVPYNIKLLKSWNFVALTPAYVRFMFSDKRAVTFHKYIRQAYIPEEEYYASIYRLPGAPGGSLSVASVSPVVVNGYIWANKEPDYTCAGRVVHGICIVTSGDLHRVLHTVSQSNQTVFFFNKYFMEDDHVIMDCLEESLIRRNMIEHAQDCP